MMFLKLNSLYLYAVNSMADKQKTRYQDTLDDYYSFMEEYPESKYSKDVKSIFQKTDKYLKSAIPVSQLNKQQ
jgi:outer membrane protein assembly factor BamD